MNNEFKAGNVMNCIADDDATIYTLMIVYDSYEDEYRTVNIKNGALSVVSFREVDDLIEFIKESITILKVYNDIVEYNKGRF